MMNFAFILFFGCFAGNTAQIKSIKLNLFFNVKCFFLHFFLLVALFDSTSANQVDEVVTTIMMVPPRSEHVSSYFTLCGRMYQVKLTKNSDGTVSISLVHDPSKDMTPSSQFSDLKITVINPVKGDLYICRGTIIPNNSPSLNVVDMNSYPMLTLKITANCYFGSLQTFHAYLNGRSSKVI